MNIRKSVLASLLLAAVGMFLAGCCKGGECPFKKIFGSKSTECKKPCETTATTTAPAEENK
jgi:hypothetical protein